MTFWTPDNLRHTLGATWLARPPSDAPITGLSTDTRTITASQAFLALKGDTFDGNAMLARAGAAGSRLAVIDNPDAAGRLPTGMGILKVPNTRRALGRLAAAYRRTLERTRIIAVCGSNGKTTTVRLLSAVLSQTMRGSASQKSFNNDIGVPLTILSASPSDQFLICEIGTNAPGEIAALSEIAQPDIAVITSIGREHLERLGSLRGVAREEASVLEFMRPGGAGFLSADTPELAEIVPTLASRPQTLLTFGFNPAADVRVESVRQSLDGISFTLNDRARFGLPLLGRHNAANAAAAVAVARRLGLSDADIATGLSAVKGESMRLEVSRHGGVCIINDAYNANPDSMRAALDTFDAVAKAAKRRVVILGDMLELGEHTVDAHREVVESLAARPHLNLIILVGPQMRMASSALDRVKAKVVLVDDLGGTRAAEVAAQLKSGDSVLLKASRRMRLERLLASLNTAAPVATA